MQNNPIVTIEMENGDVIKAELYPEIAPNTVNNFISLVKKGFYNSGCHIIILRAHRLFTSEKLHPKISFLSRRPFLAYCFSQV